jgi:RNA polymerase sigma-70 factor (ECF subfamily)
VNSLVVTAEEPLLAPEQPGERLGRLFDRHHLRLYRFALRMTRGDDEALDLVQDAFVRAARDQRRLPEDDAEAGAWLVRVVVNLLHDRYRRQQVRSAFRMAHRPAPERDFTAAIEARDAVRTAIAELPPRQRAIIVLHELEDETVSDIASKLGLASVTVRWHLAAARKRLSKLLTQGTRK